ncbi:TPA: Rho-binding antiterminator [Providencia rettgeri]
MSTDTEYQPINCDDYEYLEIACQRQFKLQIKLNGGEKIEGQASDLLLRKKVEYLIVETHEGTKELRLDFINSFSHPEIGTIVVDHSH